MLFYAVLILDKILRTLSGMFLALIHISTFHEAKKKVQLSVEYHNECGHYILEIFTPKSTFTTGIERD